MKKLVYICSPCRGDYEKNIDNAATYSRAAFRLNCMEAIAKELKIPLHILQEMQDDPTTAAGAERYARRRDPEVVAACEVLQKKVLDDFDRWLKRQLENPEQQRQRLQSLVDKRRRCEE